MTDSTTRMLLEVQEIPEAVERLLSQGFGRLMATAAAARAVAPRFAVTVARGSSDHACTYLKYAFELALGLPVASVGRSVASIYGADLRLAQSQNHGRKTRLRYADPGIRLLLR